jgi:hypothetical protein
MVFNSGATLPGAAAQMQEFATNCTILGVIRSGNV